MQAEKNGVADYLAQVPSEHLEALGELRAACLDELLGYEESISYGMPSYSRDGIVEIAFSNRKQYISFHVLRTDVVETHRDRLTGLDVGKGCIRYRRPAQIDMDVVRSILRATVASKGPVC